MGMLLLLTLPLLLISFSGLLDIGFSEGTAGADSISGDDGNEFILGREGDDVLDGNGGNDIVRGGDGNDTVKGGSGDDSVSGGADNDSVLGNSGNDSVFGGGGSDDLQGNDGDDMIFGMSGDDALFGGNGADIMVGDEGADELSGGAGADSMSGNNGDDWLSGEDGNDVVTGGLGFDLVLGGAGADRLTGEHVTGGAGNDLVNLITSEVGRNAKLFGFGGEGDDTLNMWHGGNSTDALTLDGELTGEAGNDALTVASAGNVTLSGGAGNDMLTSADVMSAVMTGGAGLDRFQILADYDTPKDDGAVTVTDFDPTAGETMVVRIYDDPDAGTAGGAVGTATLQVDVAGTGTLVIYKGITYVHFTGLLPSEIPANALLIDLVANASQG